MPKTRDRLVQKLISAGQLRTEHYLEVIHLDPPLFAEIYIRALAFRYVVRNVISFTYSRSFGARPFDAF
jgi:hypothetical protein